MTAKSSQTVNVSQASGAAVLAGPSIATITLPAAASGSGTLQLNGSAALPAQFAVAGNTNVVTIPGTAIAAITVLPSMTATYATLPTFSFTLPAGTPIANESFVLYLDDPATGSGLFPIVDFTASRSSTGVTLTEPTTTIDAPYPVGAPPVLPITYDATNLVGFVLYETPTTN